MTPVPILSVPAVQPKPWTPEGRASEGWAGEDVFFFFLHLSPPKSDLQAEPSLGEVPSGVTDLTINLLH